MRIAFIGGGGVGKSTLTYSFSKHLEKKGLKCACVNLDPGCKHIKYDAAFDLRDYCSLDALMSEFNLGPNGALKKAYSLALSNKDLRAKLHSVKGDFVLLDTAGSLELFLFGGAALLEEFADAVCFVVEQDDALEEREVTVLKALNALQRLDYSLPTVSVVNKTDLNAKAREAQMLLGGYKAADEHLTALLKELGSRERLVRVSAMDRRGFDELFDALNELNCACGDSS